MARSKKRQKYQRPADHLLSAPVTCSRNGDDQGAFPVELGDVAHACMAVARGGDFELFEDGHRLCVMVPGRLVPAQLCSGRHATHEAWNPAREAHRRVCVEREGTDPEALAWLDRQAAKDVHSVEFVLRKRARIERRKAQRLSAAAG